MTKNNSTASLVIAILALVIAGVAMFRSAPAGNDLGTVRFEKDSFTEGIFVGTNRQVGIARTGALTSSASVALTSTFSQITAGTTTAKFKSSTTKGTCFELNATSTATTINMTFAATTTGQSVVGLIPQLRYGVCP